MTIGSVQETVREQIPGDTTQPPSPRNGHQTPQTATTPRHQTSTAEGPLQLLPLSAKSAQALAALKERYQEFLAANSHVPLGDLCYTAGYGREHFAQRVAVVADSTTALRSALTHAALRTAISDPTVAFLFTGQGGQVTQMGLELYQSEPSFRATLERCDAILQPHLGRSILAILFADALAVSNGDALLLNQTAYTQPALFALEYALAELWRSWGVNPAFVMGHSVGEYVAACVAGVFSLEDGLQLIAARARLMQALPQTGSMVAIMASAADVLDLIAPLSEQVSLAAVNGPQNVVISGEQSAVQAVTAHFAGRQIKVTPLTVSHAFHSPLMEPMLDEFSAVAAAVTYHPPRIGLVSNVTGTLVREEVTSAAYWCQHVRQPVLFAAGMATLAQQGVTAFVEIGPKPTLLGMGRLCLPDGEQLWLPSLRPEQERRQLLSTLGALYTHGVAIDWQGVHRDHKRRRLAGLPTYAFQRQRYGVFADAKQPTPTTPRTQPATDVSRWLNEGNSAQLLQLLHQNGIFSDEQQALLPDLLAALLQQHQSQLAAAQSPHDQVVASLAAASVAEGTPSTAEPSLREHWQVTAEAARPSLLAAALAEQIGRVLGYTHADAPVLPHDVPLLQLGLDSLMGAELRNWAKRTLQVELAVVDLLAGPTIAQLADRLHEQLLTQQGDAPTTGEPPTQAAHGTNGAAPTAPSVQPTHYPLSFGQQALWFIHQSAPESAAYNVGLAFRLRNALDVGALHQALQQLVDHHPTLRTTFSPPRDGQDPEQIVHPVLAVDFAHAAAPSDDAALRKAVAAAYAEPFDLVRGPLMRVRLFGHPGDDSSSVVLLIAFHHIIIDAQSTWTLLHELWSTYATLCRGGALPRIVSTPLSATYHDHVVQEAARMAGPEGERLWRYWQHQLADAQTVLELPTDYPRPPMQSYAGASQSLRISAEQTAALRELARSEQVTLYMLLLAIWQLLLHRYTGQADILVGSAMAGRGQSHLANVVGYFVNPVVLRARFVDNPAFHQLLEQVRTTALEAFAHQDYPFPLLVSRLQPKRDPSRSPLFQVDFTLQKLPPIAAQLKAGTKGDGDVDLVMEPFGLDEEEGQFDLSLHIFDEDDTLRASFKYNSDLFSPATMARMTGHFTMLVSAILQNPQARIGELPLLTPAETHRLLVAWNQTATAALAFPPTQPIHHIFEAQVACTPDAAAVRYIADPAAALAAGAVTLSYRRLNRRANQLAHYLRTLGVGPDSLVGVCLERTPELVVALLAVLKAGGAYIPMDPSYPAERLAYILEDAAPKVVITQRALLAHWPFQPAALCLDDAGALLAEQPDDNVAAPITPEQLAYVIYTSGSTGRPKGTLIEHRGLSNYLAWAVQAYAVAAGVGAPVNSSIGFDATITSFFAPLLVGGEVLLLPESGELEALAATLTGAERYSLVKITPAHLEILSHLVTQADGTVPPIQANAFVIGGEALYGHQLAFWQRHAAQTRFINEYGPTETVVGCCIYDVQEALSGPVAIGRPIANTQLYLLDQYQQPVPMGIPGELYIGGAGVARGYLNRDDLTAARFAFVDLPTASGVTAKQRLYRTGDLVRCLPDGNLEYLGRLDHQVKIRGYRIELGEIEAVLAEHPLVNEVAVIAHAEAGGAKTLVAYCTVDGAAVDQGAMQSTLRQHLRAKLPDYMVPSHFILLNALPLTTNGKVDRAALPAPSGVHTSKQLVPPRNEVEMALVPIWETVLGLQPISVQDDFFDLGGNSLLAVRLTARLEQHFGRRVPLALLFQYGTVERLANLLRQRDGGEALPTLSTVVALQGAGSRPPFFCVPGAGGYVIYLYQLARALGAEQPFYGLQAAGLEGDSAPHDTVEAMAAHYVAAMQAVQPTGPYYLGGHSLGGWVAFEMAQQLQRQGEEVALVAIIDTPAPEQATFEDFTARDDARWISELGYRIKHLLAPNLAISYELLRPLSSVEQLQYLQEQMTAAELVPAEADREQIARLLAVFKAHSRITYAISPDAVPTPLLLLRTDGAATEGAAVDAADSIANNSGNFIELRNGEADPSWGWAAHGPTTVHHLPGDHLSILRAPHVTQLAAHLGEALAQQPLGGQRPVASGQ